MSKPAAITAEFSETSTEEIPNGTEMEFVEIQDAQSFAELEAYYGEQIIEVDGAEPEAKSNLVNVPFIILNWEIGKNQKFDSDKGFIIVRAITKDDKKIFFTDGGAGIQAQLQDIFTRTSRKGGILIKKGLRESKYTVKDEKGKDIESTTYYLS